MRSCRRCRRRREWRWLTYAGWRSDAHGDPAPEGGSHTGGFSEMALYVLVRRGGSWWLAAGQNTPIRLAEAPSRA